MSAVPAANYLTDFRRERHVTAGPSFVPFGHHERQSATAQTVSGADLIEAARANGFADGETAARAVLEARLAQEREAFARQLESERRAWAYAEAEKLTQRLTSGLREMETRIAQSAARALEPLVQQGLRQQVIAQVHSELVTLLAKDAGIAVSVAGPADLLAALRERIGDSIGAVTYAPDSEPEVRVTAGHTILETRLATWAARIKEAIA